MNHAGLVLKRSVEIITLKEMKPLSLALYATGHNRGPLIVLRGASRKSKRDTIWMLLPIYRSKNRQGI